MEMGMRMKCSVHQKRECWGGKNAWRYVGSPLPIKDRREELGNQTLIVWAEGFSVNRIITLAVQVVWVERANRSKGSLVLFVCEVRVRALSVPSVRREISEPECVRKDGVLTGKSCGNGSSQGPLRAGMIVLSGHDTDTTHTLGQRHARGCR